MTLDVAEVERRVDATRQRIVDAGGDPARVRLMAVTKAFGPEVVEVAHAAGLRLLGESYVQEYVGKLDLTPESVRHDVEWHFIGRLQRNKVRQLPDDVAVIQSVDRVSLVEEIARRRPGQRVMIQVNLGDEPQKGGCSIADTSGLVATARDLGLVVDGLMGVAEAAIDDVVTTQFGVLRTLADDLELVERSMGMTADLELAVGAGSTMVRVGSALFGQRPPR